MEHTYLEDILQRNIRFLSQDMGDRQQLVETATTRRVRGKDRNTEIDLECRVKTATGMI